MINPINSINSINVKQLDNKRQKIQTQSSSNKKKIELSGYETSQAILARNNISFKNLAYPIETTHSYNKKTEGKNHLDLPNIHVYEFEDTNLRMFVNETDNKTIPQISMVIEPDVTKYNPLKQALVNKIIAKSFQQNNLSNFYDEDIYSHIQFVSSSSEQPMTISDIQKANRILTSTQFDKKMFENAKQELKKYIFSEKYIRENLLGKELYKDCLLTENETCQMIDDITFEDLQEYHKDILNNSTMEICLTLNKDTPNKNNLLTQINDSINNKFLKNISTYNKILNNQMRILYSEDTNVSLELNYFINNTTIQDEIITKIVQKLIAMHSDFEQNRINKYAENKALLKYSNEENQDEQMFYKNMIIKHETEANFTNPAGYQNRDCVLVPLNLAEFNPTQLYGEFCKIQLQSGNANEDVNFNELIHNHYKSFNDLLNSDLNSDIYEIKNNLKKYLKESLKGGQPPVIKNLETALYGTDSFQIFETIDSITEEDVKNYIKKYFINQPPIVQISGPKEIHQQKSSQPIFRGRQSGLNHLKHISNEYDTVTLTDTITQSIKKIFSQNKNTTYLPIVSTPILLYMQTKSEKIVKKIAKETEKVSDKSFTNNYNDSINTLKDAGITGDTSKYINSATGRLNTTGQNAIKPKESSFKGSPEHDNLTENSNTNFDSSEPTGFFDKLSSKISDGWNQFKEKLGISHGPEQTLERNLDLTQETSSIEVEMPRITIQDIVKNPSLINGMSAKEIGQIDVSMCPELEEFLHTPPDEIPDGLMSSILDDLPEGFGIGNETLYNTLKSAMNDLTDMMGS